MTTVTATPAGAPNDSRCWCTDPLRATVVLAQSAERFFTFRVHRS